MIIEHPYPPRLQGETLRIGSVFTRFLVLDLDETLSKASQEYFEDLDTIFSRVSKSTYRGYRRSQPGNSFGSQFDSYCLP